MSKSLDRSSVTSIVRCFVRFGTVWIIIYKIWWSTQPWSHVGGCIRSRRWGIGLTFISRFPVFRIGITLAVFNKAGSAASSVREIHHVRKVENSLRTKKSEYDWGEGAVCSSVCLPFFIFFFFILCALFIWVINVYVFVFAYLSVFGLSIISYLIICIHFLLKSLFIFRRKG